MSISIAAVEHRIERIKKVLRPLLSPLMERAKPYTERLKQAATPAYERAMAFANSRWVFWSALVLLPLFVLIYYPSRTEDYDIWYHLKFGEHFIKDRTFQLDHSIFSWTPADPTWRYGIWIGSSIFYVMFTLFSAPGLYIVQWMIFIGIALLYLKYLKVIGASFDVSDIFSLFMVFMALNLTAIYIKPELFTTFLFAVAVFLYFYIKQTLKNHLLWYWYPPLLLLWVNTHGGYLMGLFLISAAGCGELINSLLVKRNHLPWVHIKHFFFAVVLSYAAVIINPYGLDYHIAILKTFVSEKYMSYGMQVLAWDNLWKYLKQSGTYRFYNTAWSLVFMTASFYVLSLYAFVRKRFLDITLLILVGVFFYIGMKAARVTIFLPLLWMFSVLYVLKQVDALHLKKLLAPVTLLAFLYLGAYLVQVTATTLEDRSWFGTNILRYTPAKETAFIKRFHLPGPLFNDYVMGGYLIWTLYPEYKVFIDPRYGPYWKETGPDYFNLMNYPTPDAFRQFNGKYPFRTIILEMREQMLINTILQMPEWQLIYFDTSAVVFVHKSVLPLISEEALATVDMSTNKFQDVHNPEVLDNVFGFYLSINPELAKQIYDIYSRNVSDFYMYKQYRMKAMLAQIQNAASGNTEQQHALPPGHP